jgi:choline monooxygenase
VPAAHRPLDFMKPPEIHPDMATARSLPGNFHADPRWFEIVRDRVFAQSWQLIAHEDELPVSGACLPVTLLKGLLDEPLILTRDGEGTLHALSNVCTHRGALVCEQAAVLSGLRCRYHGRRFDLRGRLISAPGFDGVPDFPTEADHLPAVFVATWRKLIFASLSPLFPLPDLMAGIDSRVDFLPFERAVLDRARSRDYDVAAGWGLYCDNYLEGLHIPFVHPGLAATLDVRSYRTELLPWGSLQIGVASGDDGAFELPPGHPDFGQRIAAYYFWLFPNLMLNVYPWGVSVNIVRPLAVDRTRVSFLSYVWDPALVDKGASADLDRVEREDEAVVESVQRGMRSRLYRGGRYAPRHESGTHHFHRLLAEFLSPAADASRG